MADAFKFPDEQEDNQTTVADTAGEADVEIEIVDDTPERDRGRKPLEKEVADPTDDEIESYSDRKSTCLNSSHVSESRMPSSA